jgi:micrococcal nuclease
MLLRMGHRSRWLVAGIVFGLVACTGQSPSVAAAGDPQPPGRAFGARVDRVVDGDTFIAVRRGVRVRVRLIGVNAPESVKPNWPVECWGPEASRLLKRLLPGTRVRAAYQAGGRTDRYGRDLWDVWLPDGRFVQAVIVRRGAADAVAYRPQVEHVDLLARIDAAATAARRGLHGAC